MGKAPAFQFYANDFMDATRFMEANAVGLYVRCLCIQWTQGGIPEDLRTLSKGVGMDFEEFTRAWPSVASKFTRDEDGLLKNSRLEAVRSRQEEVSSKRSDAGKAGAIAKANAKANGSTKDKQRKVKVEGEEERERKERATQKPTDPDFEAVWLAYEKYGAKGKALAYWQKLTHEDRAAIIAKVPEYVGSTPGCEFRKQLEGWINPDNRLWERPIVKKATPAKQEPMAWKEAEDEMNAIRAKSGRRIVEPHEMSERLRKYNGF